MKKLGKVVAVWFVLNLVLVLLHASKMIHALLKVRKKSDEDKYEAIAKQNLHLIKAWRKLGLKEDKLEPVLLGQTEGLMRLYHLI